MLRRDATVTSVTYVEGRPHIRYVADAPLLDGSVVTTPTLEDAYIYALGGVKQ